MTRRLAPEERIRELGDASVPFPFDVHALIQLASDEAAKAKWLEMQLTFEPRFEPDEDQPF